MARELYNWDQLESYGLSFSTWRKLLPDTIEVTKKAPPGYLYKPAWGRVGEKISIQEACEEGEYQKCAGYQRDLY